MVLYGLMFSSREMVSAWIQGAQTLILIDSITSGNVCTFLGITKRHALTRLNSVDALSRTT